MAKTSDSASSIHENGDATPDAAAAAPAEVAVIAEGESGEGGKMKMIVQLVKRCLGVKDIAAMRLSLPASLLEPLPNLEYWNYLDRPDLFAAINDSADPFERMLAVLRFTFSKDLKFIRGKICKPYNSVLGEHFRAHWVVNELTYPPEFPRVPPTIEAHLHHPHGAPIPELPIDDSDAGGSQWSSDAVSLKSSKSNNARQPAPDRGASSIKSGADSGFLSVGGGDKKMAASAEDVSKLGEGLEQLNVEFKEELDDPEDFKDAEDEKDEDGVRVIFLTEQISHHPPASDYYFAAPDKGVEAFGVDQISAKVSGTTVRITPGSMNKGIFISITSGHGAGEEYHITHPAAHVNGILRGNFYATMTDSTIITCTNSKSGQNLRAIIDYKEESWLGRPQFLVDGCIHTYDADPTKREWDAWTKVKYVPPKNVVATFDGSWRKKIEWKKAGSTTPNTLIDIDMLSLVPKSVRPLSQQLPNESRKLWEGVTTNLLSKNFNEATKIKQVIEQKQRDIAAQRKATGKEFVPVYFEADISSGKPVLTEAGRKAVQDELKTRL
ncbi:hypothetical protein FRB95_002554 [Tulasnella sp. JGI-2019a]|nr:hypothetical protein FRB95_002554 [Tulasnella sp. JGI-2019a]